GPPDSQEGDLDDADPPSETSMNLLDQEIQNAVRDSRFASEHAERQPIEGYVKAEE
ncbi:hypothetical protein HDU93_002352, partial [Gonapodya sp. JEL0774]